MRAPLLPLAFLGLGLAGMSLCGAPRAYAHGGVINPPAPVPPSVPPYLRPDPYAPRPPTPPRPPTGPPPTTPPVGPPDAPPPTTPPGGNGPGKGPVQPTGNTPPAPTPAPPTTPKSGPPPGKPTGPQNPRPGVGDEPPSSPPAKPGAHKPVRRGKSAAGLEGLGWRDWWDTNADALRRAVRSSVTTEGDGQTNADELLSRHLRREQIVPLLRRVADRELGNDHDLVASAFLALARTTADEEDVNRLLQALGTDATPPLERESAALALGYLRRTTKSEGLPGRLLDHVRAGLFDAIDDDGVHVRCRCFAALALGLLGDQPGADDDAFARDGRLVVRGLWSRLLEDRAGQETTVALLVALSLQPPAGVPGAVRDGLRALATTGRLGNRPRGPLAEAHAALALARLSGGESAGVFLGLLKSGARNPQSRRAAILALGLCATTADAAQRATAETELMLQGKRGDPQTAGLAILTAARLLAVDLTEPHATLPCDPAATAEALLDAAEHGGAGVRPFAALGLGLACRPVMGDAPATLEQLRGRALPLLRRVLAGDALEADARGAYAVGLGLARDDASLPLLGRLVSEGSVEDDLRAASCAGLGLLGRATPEVLAVLRRALAPTSDDEIRREAARALGSLGDRKASGSLLRELEADGPDHVRARAAVALGVLRDPGSVPALAELVRDPKRSDATRALAVAALGLVGDPERVPSSARLAVDANFLVRTDALEEALSIL